jgi:hypothetical protein
MKTTVFCNTIYIACIFKLYASICFISMLSLTSGRLLCNHGAINRFTSAKQQIRLSSPSTTTTNNSNPHSLASYAYTYVPEGSEITFTHVALHFHVSGGGTLNKNADHDRMLRTVTLRLLFKYPVDPLQCRKDVDVSLLHLHQQQYWGVPRQFSSFYAQRNNAYPLCLAQHCTLSLMSRQ